MKLEEKTTCYCCDEPISELNISEEHILLNAIGGRLSSRFLLCRGCNSRLGHETDSALAKQLNYFMNILQFERQKGLPQPILGKKDSTGEEFSIDREGKIRRTKPEVKIEKTGQVLRVEITARDRTELEVIIKQLAKKCPEIDPRMLVEMARDHEEEIGEMLHSSVTVGGVLENQSVAKTAIGFYLHRGLDKRHIVQCIDALKTGSSNKLVEPISFAKLPYVANDGEIPHIIYLRGDPAARILFGYVEFFGVYGFLVKLNLDYKGPKVEECYYFDLIERSERADNTEFEFDPEFVRKYKFSESKPDFVQMQNGITKILKIAVERMQKKAIKEALDRAWVESFTDIKEGEIIPPELHQVFVANMMKEMQPIILRMIDNPKSIN